MHTVTADQHWEDRTLSGRTFPGVTVADFARGTLPERGIMAGPPDGNGVVPVGFYDGSLFEWRLFSVDLLEPI